MMPNNIINKMNSATVVARQKNSGVNNAFINNLSPKTDVFGNPVGSNQYNTTANHAINTTAQNYFLNKSLNDYYNHQDNAVKIQYDRELEAAKIASATSAEEARKAREWVEKMSNTSYQRAVKDLIAAGLNPALAYSQGGASTPSAAVGTAYKANSSASNYNTGGYFNVLSSAISSATQLRSEKMKSITKLFNSLLEFLG